MPILSLKPGNRVWPSFLYPKNGKVKILLEASIAVDVFIAHPNSAPQITSIPVAQSLPGVLALPAKTKLDYMEITIPPAWNGVGWCLVFGNPHTTEYAAVYYTIIDV